MTFIMLEKKQLRDYTTGSISKALLALSIPIVLANILQTVYQLTDTFWVGRLGANAVAAVSISFPIMFLLISLGGGMAIAGTILVSQYTGRKEMDQVDYISAQTMLLLFFISLILTFIGYYASAPILEFMRTPPAVLPGAISYLQVSFLGLIFLFTFFVFQSLMRGVGDVKTPVYIVLGTVLLNLLLDPLFIFGWGSIPAFGVAGAAIATISTQGLAGAIGIFMLFSGKYGIHLKWHNLKPDFSLIKKMFRLGFPASIEQSTRALGLTFMVFLVTGFGTNTLAAYGIGGRILSFFIIPALGFSMALSTIVGQNLGAGKIQRAKESIRVASWMIFWILTVAGFIVFLFAKPLTTIFIPGDPAVIDTSTTFVRIIALSFGFMGVQQTIGGGFRGSGNTFIAMALSIISLWILRFPLAWLLSTKTILGINGLWWSFPIANVIAALLAIYWFKKDTWLNKKVTEKLKLTRQTTEESFVEEGLQ